MFAIINEAILKNLINIHKDSNENKFKNEFYQYVKILKENKSLKTYYDTYNMYKEAKFTDQMTAYMFIDEVVKKLKSIDPSDLDKLKEIVNENEIYVEDHLLSLDELVFNNDLNIYETIEHKNKLLEHLLSRGDYENFDLDTLQNKINEKLEHLNDSQIEALELFMENDQSKINNYYNNLIDEANSLILNKINEIDDIDVVKKLIESSKKLTELKQEQPNIVNIEQIIDLKESF